jgi:hypothetical protein
VAATVVLTKVVAAAAVVFPFQLRVYALLLLARLTQLWSVRRVQIPC